jgi:hypothetical protein
LREGCLAFRKIIMEKTDGIDPFENNITIASLCHHIFRKKLMKKDSIGIIPEKRYMNQNTSRLADLWLKWLAYTRNIFIRHNKNGGELKFDKYYVDGYSEERLSNGQIIQTIYEVNGCYFMDVRNVTLLKLTIQLKIC